MNVREKAESGELYDPFDPQVLQEQLGYLDDLKAYNDIPHVQLEAREAKLRSMLAEMGEGCYVESPFYSNFGGRHVHLGNHVYANFNVTLVDDTHIYIGDYTMIGPNVVIVTAAHPICPELREQGYEFNLPVHIGRNCWLGAGVQVMPGVTIGDNSVIGAGSVVTKDVPANVVAVGSPCRVLREIGEYDREFYHRGRKIDPALFQTVENKEKSEK